MTDKNNQGSMEEMCFVIPRFGKEMRITWDDGMAYLPLFYFIPKEVVEEEKPAYLEIPRSFYHVLCSGKAMGMIRSPEFVKFVEDVFANWFWFYVDVPGRNGEYKSIPGYLEYYSADFPIRTIVYQLVKAALDKYRKFMGKDFVRLFTDTRYVEMRWMEIERFNNHMIKGTEELIKELNLQPIIDTVWEYRQVEDYEGDNYCKQDFMRSWYHRRTAGTVSFDEMMETGAKIDGRTLYEMEDPRSNFEKRVLTE